jgi:hypothetical protein
MNKHMNWQEEILNLVDDTSLFTFIILQINIECKNNRTHIPQGI